MKKFLTYGFSEQEIKKIENLVKFISQDLKIVTINDEDFKKTLKEVSLEEKFNIQVEFNINEKIVIFENVFHKEIDVYIRILKDKLSKKIIFATVTENSKNMTIEALIKDFLEEREYFRSNKR